MDNKLNDTDITQVVDSEKSKNEKENVVIDLDLVSENINEELTRLDRKDIDYSTDGDFILFSTETLVKVLTQLTTIIDVNSPRKVSRGLSFIIKDGKLTLVTPNELFYFKSYVTPEKCTLSNGTIFHIDFSFLIKIIRFLPLKVLIYKKEGIYYLRLVTGDLELIDTVLMDSDIRRLDQDWEVLDTVVCTLNRDEVLTSLGTLNKLYSFASDLPRRVFDIKNDLVQFITPFVQATSTLHFPEVRLFPPVVNYLLKACSLCSTAGSVSLYETSSQTITRYAIVFDDIIMITNFADSKFVENTKALRELLPSGTAIQFSELKYTLEYVNSITYASGPVTFIVDGDKVLGKVKLNNNNESLIELPVISNEISLPRDLKATVNSKDLYKALCTLDANSTTYIGYSEGFIYLWNTKIVLTITTYGG